MAESYLLFALICHVHHEETKDEHKTKVIVIVVVAVVNAIISGMLLIAYLMYKRRTKFRGNFTFSNLQKTYFHVV